jgi:hypothetical protein
MAKDALIGSTISIAADQAVKTATGYNGVADGILRSIFGENIRNKS